MFPPCDPNPHDWKQTGKVQPFVKGPLFREPTPIVIMMKCAVCGQVGYRKPGSKVVYTWVKDEIGWFRA